MCDQARNYSSSILVWDPITTICNGCVVKALHVPIEQKGRHFINFADFTEDKFDNFWIISKDGGEIFLSYKIIRGITLASLFPFKRLSLSFYIHPTSYLPTPLFFASFLRLWFCTVSNIYNIYVKAVKIKTC